jgi:hypothetical protein
MCGLVSPRHSGVNPAGGDIRPIPRGFFGRIPPTTSLPRKGECRVKRRVRTVTAKRVPGMFGSVYTRVTQAAQGDCHGGSCRIKEVTVIVLGVVLLLIGFVAKIAIVWTLGILALVVGAILAIAGAAGRELGGRRHWY